MLKRMGKLGGAALGWVALTGRTMAAGAAGISGLAMADGPGLPNKTWTAAQVGKPIAMIESREGHGSVAMHRGYLVIIYSKDSGAGNGGFAFFDLSDPTAPEIVHNHDDATTQAIREPHGWGMRGDIACLQANEGMHFWDWSDVTQPKLLSYLKLPDIQISDYDKGLWWTSWQGGSVYGGGSGNGLYIVDAKDPAKPVFIKKIPTSVTGGFRVGPVFAIGNLLVLTSTDVAGFSTLDIGDPANPKLIATVKAGVSYAAMVNGNRILGSGSESELGRLLVYDITDPAKIIHVGNSNPMGDKGGYAMYSDGYAFSGFSSKGFGKFDITKPGIPLIQAGTGAVAGADQDFCTALGNLVFASSDHAGGSGLIPHQTARDSAGPAVNMVVPKDGAVKQPLTTRVGLTFTDLLDKATLGSANFTVRPVGGEAIDGYLATQTGILNFSPLEPLKANTTYEVIVKAGGIKDYAGNGVPKEFRSLFSTGNEITTPVRAQALGAAPRPSARPGLHILPPGISAGATESAEAGSAASAAGWVDIQGRSLSLPGGQKGAGGSAD